MNRGEAAIVVMHFACRRFRMHNAAYVGLAFRETLQHCREPSAVIAAGACRERLVCMGRLRQR
jgi:hypothetical protein